MNWTLIMLNNRLYKIKNTYKLGFLRLKLIKSSLIVIRFSALLLAYEHKRVILKGENPDYQQCWKFIWEKNQSCPSWHGLKLHWVLPNFLYQSSPWWYTWSNYTISTYLTLHYEEYDYSRILDKKQITIRNTITF